MSNAFDLDEHGNAPPQPPSNRSSAAQEQHLDDSVVAYLRKSSLLVPLNFRTFYDNFWGRPCGLKRRGVTYCASTIDVTMSHVFLVRDDYRQAYEELVRAAKRKGNSATVWYGQPGVGKSLGLRYAILCCAELCRPVIFWPAPTTPVIIMTNQGIFAIPEQSYQPFPFRVKPLILLVFPPPRTDLPPHLYENPVGPICLASSPKEPRFKAFVRKLQANFRVFDLFHSNELDTLLVLTAEDSIGREEPEVVMLSEATSSTMYQVPPLQTLAADYEGDDDYPMQIAAPASVSPPLSSASPSAASPNEMPASPSDEEDTRILQAAPAAAVASLAHLPLHVRTHWLKLAVDERKYTPIEIFRQAGPTVRAPMLGVLRRTGDFRRDYLGENWESLPVSALTDLYRILSTNVDPKSTSRIRSDDQLADFHLLFFETPTTKDLTGGQPASRYIIPTAMIRDLIISTLAKQETAPINYFSREGIVIEALDASAISVPPALPLLPLDTRLAIPLDHDYIAKLPPNHPTYDTIIVLPSQKLVIAVQLTVSRDHKIVAAGLNLIEARCGDEINAMGMKRLFMFVGPEGAAAKHLAEWHRAGRGLRDSDGRLLEPEKLSLYELGHAELGIEELVGKFSEVMVETSPQLPQSACFA